jgi:predicted house-cleaning noncanonical NTP pyrophosphatase (MazG superfamily)
MHVIILQIKKKQSSIDEIIISSIDEIIIQNCKSKTKFANSNQYDKLLFNKMIECTKLFLFILLMM